MRILNCELRSRATQLTKNLKVIVPNKCPGNVLVLKLEHLSNLRCKLDKLTFTRWLLFFTHYGCCPFLLISLFDDAAKQLGLDPLVINSALFESHINLPFLRFGRFPFRTSQTLSSHHLLGLFLSLHSTMSIAFNRLFEVQQQCLLELLIDLLLLIYI